MGGIPHGNAGGLVSGTLVRSGQAVPPFWMLTNSPGLCPLTDTSMWVTALGHQSQAFLVTGAGVAGGTSCCALCGCLDEDECPVKGVAKQQMVPEINKISINELQWLWMPN